MSDIKTADQKYYASKDPLELNPLAEGPSFKPSHFAYQPKMGVGGRSSDVYYASPEQYQEPVVEASKPELVAMLQLGPDIVVLEQIIDAYSRGMTSVSISGSQEEINAARVAVDLAVGRNTLTRKQADDLSWVVIAETPVQPLPTEEAPVIETAPASAPVVEAQPQVEPKVEEQEPIHAPDTKEAAQDEGD
jgi:hypothetical protein